MSCKLDTRIPNIFFFFFFLRVGQRHKISPCKLDTRIPNKFWPFFGIGQRHKISPCTIQKSMATHFTDSLNGCPYLFQWERPEWGRTWRTRGSPRPQRALTGTGPAPAPWCRPCPPANRSPPWPPDSWQTAPHSGLRSYSAKKRHFFFLQKHFFAEKLFFPDEDIWYFRRKFG